MRPTSTHVIILACVATAACEPTQRTERMAPATTHEVAASPLAALGAMSRPIDTLNTLGGWMATHPTDVASVESTRDVASAENCRVMKGDLVIGVRHAERMAEFSLPAPPPGEALPTDTTRIAERLCHLRAIRLESAEPDSLRAIAYADSVASMLRHSLGAEKSEKTDTTRWGSPKSWTVQGTQITVAIEQPFAGSDDMGRPFPPEPRRVVIVASGAPNPEMGEGDWRNRPYEDNEDAAIQAIEAARVDSAIAWADVPVLAADLRHVLDYERRDHDWRSVRPADVSAALLRAARVTHDTASFLAPMRRAAALLATDMVLALSVGTLDVDSAGADETLRHSLDSLGLTYDYSPLGYLYRYTRPWLWEAYRADPEGRVGHEAFMTLLSNGWTTRSGCQDGAAEYDKVITHGEAALERGDRDPLIRYYVGIAHHDIVALSLAGEHDDYVDPSEFAPLAPSARVHAIEHFRAFLASPADTRLRRRVWRMAMSLLSGHARGTTFFCIYD